jgi:hypothetical protein
LLEINSQQDLLNVRNTKCLENNVYGPVDGKRWTGTWQDKEITIEVWKIIKTDKSGYDYVVEASFKTKDCTDAENRKKQLQQELTKQGWFLPIDELKTQMILERYTCYVLNFDLIEALDRLRFGDFSRSGYLSLYLQGKKL